MYQRDFWSRQFGLSWDGILNLDNPTIEISEGINYYLTSEKTIRNRYNHNIDFGVFDKDEIEHMAMMIHEEHTICNYLYYLCDKNEIGKLRSLILFENEKSIEQFVYFVLNNSYYKNERAYFMIMERIPQDMRYLAQKKHNSVLWNWGI